MAPLRRYLRITRHSILEVRIYLDNPVDLHRWLIHPQRPMLPDILKAVKPYVLPKLREENARAAGKKAGPTTGGTKRKGKKGVRDVVITDSFEVSIFLTELSTPHAVLVRTRDFTAKNLTTGSKDVPLIIREEGNDDEDADVQLLRQESNVPSKDQSIKTEDNASKSLPQDLNTTDQTGGGGGENDALSVSSHDDDDDEAVEEEEDEKKKLSLKTSYEGFQIYGRILCLVVKRKGQPNNIPASMNRQKNSNASTSVAAGANGQESIVEMVQRTASSAGRRDEGIMEGWMRSTQIGNESRGIAGGRDPDSDDGDDAG